MIQTSTFEFLKALRANNYREWFHENKAWYDREKANVIATGNAVLGEINRFDTAIGFPDLKKCMFRIARDTRFSTNKSPYKTNFGVVMNPDGRIHSPLSCYYMHVEPGDCFLSCGIYMPEPAMLKAIREAIDGDWEEFQGIIEDKKFKNTVGDLAREDKVLKRVPAGFDKDSPAAEYLKLTNYYVYVPVKEETMCAPDFAVTAGKIFETMAPLQRFLNKAIENR